MDQVTILGYSNAVPGEQQENAYFLAASKNRTILVDCGNTPVQKLQALGVEPDHLTDLILTHFHPDHVSSGPLLLMDLWLQGRKQALTIHGLAYTLDRFKAMMELFNWDGWPGFYPVAFNILPEDEMHVVLEAEDLRVLSSPVKHLIPTVGLRMEFSDPGQVVVYSSDTEPAPAMVRLAANADVLIHEATGESKGHSSAAQAAQIALEAGARKLVLIHYGAKRDKAELIGEANQVFPGPVVLAEDF